VAALARSLYADAVGGDPGYRDDAACTDDKRIDSA
jgi:hypothetical protein